MSMSLKKTLDKYPEQVYNLRIGCEGFPYIGDYYNNRLKEVYPNIEDDNEHLPSSYIRTSLEVYQAKVKEVWYEGGFDKIFPNTPVFAGGIIRDLCVVHHAHDVDLFINTYGMSEEDVEDNIALFCYKLGGKMEEHRVDESAYAHRRGEGVNEFKKGNFVIFNVTIEGTQYRLQVIARDCGPPEENTNPLDITKDFDYNLVKAAMDIDGLIYLSPEFRYGYEERTLVIYKESGKQRSEERLYGFQLKVIDLSTLTNANDIMDAKLKEREKHLAKFINQTNYDYQNRAPMPGMRFI